MKTNTQLLNAVNEFKKKALNDLKYSEVRINDLKNFTNAIDEADEALARIVLVAREDKAL